jgi:Na+-transporting NADH:ubiquinone oxidoreductase subunit NqrD
MKQTSIRWNVVFAAIYVFLFACSLYLVLEVAAQDAFVGIFAVTLTLPWSLVMIPIVAAVMPSAFDSIIPGTIIVTLGAVINTILLVYGFSWVKALSKNKTKG